MFMRKVIDTCYDNLKNRVVLVQEERPKKEKGYEYTIVENIDLKDINKISKLIIETNKKVKIMQIYYLPLDKCLVIKALGKLDLQIFKKKLENSVNLENYKKLDNFLKNKRDVKFGEIKVEEIKDIYLKVAEEFKDKKNDLKAEIEFLMKAFNMGYTFLSNMDYNYKTDIVTLEFDRKDKVSFELLDGIVLNSKFPFLDGLVMQVKELFKKYYDFYFGEINVKSTNSCFYLMGNMSGFRLALKDIDEKELFAYIYDYMSDDFMIRGFSKYYLNFLENNKSYILEAIYFDINSLPIWMQKESLIQKKESLNLKAPVRERIKKFFKSLF